MSLALISLASIHCSSIVLSQSLALVPALTLALAQAFVLALALTLAFKAKTSTCTSTGYCNCTKLSSWKQWNYDLHFLPPVHCKTLWARRTSSKMNFRLTSYWALVLPVFVWAPRPHASSLLLQCITRCPSGCWVRGDAPGAGLGALATRGVTPRPLGPSANLAIHNWKKN